MKILRIIPSMNPASGGPCQGIRNIIPALEKLGIHNEVVCLDDPAEVFFGNDPFIIHALGPANNPWRHSPRLIPWLLNNLGSFDIVIIHALWLYHGFAFEKAFRKFRDRQGETGKEKKVPKYFVMPHGMLDPYFQRTEERKLKALRNWAYWKLIEGKLVNRASGVLFTSAAELLLAREPFRPYHPKKEINIGYGIEAPPPFEASMKEAFLAKCSEIKDQPFLLFLSRIHEKKGIDHLVEAYARLTENIGKQKNEDISILPKLVIAGPGLDSLYGKKLQEMVSASATLRHLIFFPGMLTGNAKWGAFYGCEAFILPSHQENFGIAIVEALACGKPVLISYQVNIWREIVAFGAGIVADDTTGGAELLLASWSKLSNEGKKKMCEQASICFEKEFTIGSAAERFYNIFRQDKHDIPNPNFPVVAGENL